MAKINCEKELYFIHIPKNAGTAFCNQFCNGKQIGHRPVTMFNDEIVKKSIAIVRNPYDRLVSVYEYNKTKESYWHRHDGKNGKTKPPLMEYCMTHTFAEFVRHLVSGGFNNLTHPNNLHIKTQYSYIKPKVGKVKTQLIHFENLNEELSQVLGKSIELQIQNKSDRQQNHWINYYEDNGNNLDNGNNVNTSLKDLVYQYYKYDFMIGGYSK